MGDSFKKSIILKKATLYNSSFFAHLAVLGLLLPVLALAWRSDGTAEGTLFELPLALNHIALALGLTLWACGAGLRRLKHRAQIPIAFLGASTLGSLSVLGLDWGSGLAILGAIQVGMLAIAPCTPWRVAGLLVTGLFGLTYGQCYAALGYTPLELFSTGTAVVSTGVLTATFAAWNTRRLAAA